MQNMTNKLTHEYRKFVRHNSTLRRILSDTEKLLKELSVSNIENSNIQDLQESKLITLGDNLQSEPIIVLIGPSSEALLQSLINNLELDDTINCGDGVTMISHLNFATQNEKLYSEYKLKFCYLNHAVFRDGLKIIVSQEWNCIRFKNTSPILLYGVSEQNLNAKEVKDLIQLRFEWSEVPICFVCLDTLIDTQLQDICDQLEKAVYKGFLLGPAIGVERIDGVPGFVKCCLQEILMHISLQLHEIQSQYLRNFILSAFDMARELQITPRRLKYAEENEAGLHQELIRVASDKQEEITKLIESTLSEMRDSLLEQAAESAETDSETAATRQLQQLILGTLSRAVAKQLLQSVDCLQYSYVGTLQRCLQSLEEHCQDSQQEGSLLATDALRQSLSAAYCVELSASPTNIVTSVLKRLRHMFRSFKLPWSAPLQLDASWRRKVAGNILDSLSAEKLAKSICAQFKEKVRTSHEAFQEAMKILQCRIEGKLERTEEQRVAIRKKHAPRLARLALESTSMCDMVRYGMPKLGREIGRGQYGVVYASDSWGGSGPCAVKSVVPPDDRHWNDLAMEFYYTRTLPEHCRIVRVRGSVVDMSYGVGCTPAVLLVMDRLTRDLYCGLRAGMEWLHRLQVAIDVVEGIRFLHAQGLVHRDIKLKNVLLDNDQHAKLTDLGFCIPEAMMSGSIVGTPIHMAPELLSGHYDSSVDVYAFGILFWYLCAGHVRLPYVFEQCLSKEQLWKDVLQGVRPERLPKFDEQCWHLMEQCWAAEPVRRPLLGAVQPQLEIIYQRMKKTNLSVIKL